MPYFLVHGGKIVLSAKTATISVVVEQKPEFGVLITL